MNKYTLVQSIENLKKSFIESIITDCPSELHACEACAALECSDNNWTHCKTRLETAAQIDSNPASA